jgi:hypothetical protein
MIARALHRRSVPSRRFLVQPDLSARGGQVGLADRAAGDSATGRGATVTPARAAQGGSYDQDSWERIPMF